MDAQLKKGILELCLLQCLSGEPLYGYDIIQTMHAYFPDVTESTFYAVLRRLDKEGSAETFRGEVSNGPARKYYRLTDAGRQRLAEMRADWRELQRIAKALGIADSQS